MVLDNDTRGWIMTGVSGIGTWRLVDRELKHLLRANVWQLAYLELALSALILLFNAFRKNAIGAYRIAMLFFHLPLA